MRVLDVVSLPLVAHTGRHGAGTNRCDRPKQRALRGTGVFAAFRRCFSGFFGRLGCKMMWRRRWCGKWEVLACGTPCTRRRKGRPRHVELLVFMRPFACFSVFISLL